MAENKNIEVGGRLHSIATGNVLAGANEIFDDDKNKKQSEINTETYTLVNEVNAKLDGLSPEQQGALEVATKANKNEANLGYYVCSTEENVAAKVISDATGYILSKGGSMKVKMTNTNTVANATLNINSTGAKPLYYDGERASANNSWEAGETVEIYYDGTNYYANNVASGSSDGVFDVSKKYPTSGVEGGNTYTLEGALAVLNTNLPASKKKGGMSIKFVQSSDNTYVQFRLMLSTFNATQFANTANWQGVTDTPVAGSKDVMSSDGTNAAIVDELLSNKLFTVGAYIRASDGAIVSNGSMKCTPFIRVKTGDVLNYYLNIGSDGRVQVALYSKANADSWIEHLLVAQDGNYHSGTITMSQDGYIVVCTQASRVDNCYIDLQGSFSEKMRNQFQSVNNSIEVLGNTVSANAEITKQQFVSADSINLDKYIRNDGYIGTSNITNTTDFIKVSSGDVIKYRLSNDSNGTIYAYMIALYDDADYRTFNSFLLQNAVGGVYEGSIAIPSDGYIVVQNVKTYSHPSLCFAGTNGETVMCIKDDIEDLKQGEDTLGNNVFDINKCRKECIHHDNFSREESGYAIGQNSQSGSDENTYSFVDSSEYDDGLVVDDGATFVNNSSRTHKFSLRQINAVPSKGFAIELNAPTTTNSLLLGYDVKDINNFKAIKLSYNGSRYDFVIINVVGGSYGEQICNVKAYQSVAQVMTIVNYGGNIYVYLDDTLKIKVSNVSISGPICIGAYKGDSSHYDFINVFNISSQVLFNPNHILDSGVSTYPLISTSANEGCYSLDNENVHYEGYSDKFHLTPDSEPISHGIRTERSVQALFQKNLMTLRVSFDVFFVGTDVEDTEGDIFFQMHDRDGIARTSVPFYMRLKNGKACLTINSTYSPKSASIDSHISDKEICTLEKDKWLHFDIYLKQRYDADQHPLSVIRIDGKKVYESHYPNCFNDLVPSSPQYGIYKNVWGTGITERNRYFDNFKIEYL